MARKELSEIQELIQMIQELIEQIKLLAVNIENLNTNISSTQEKLQEDLQVSEQNGDSPRNTSIAIGDLIRITNSKVASEQIGAVTKVTAGRIFFRFCNTGRLARRASYNTKRVNQE